MDTILTKFIYFNNYYLFGFMALLVPNALPFVMFIFLPYTILVILGQFYKKTGIFGEQRNLSGSYDQYTIDRFAKYSKIKTITCSTLLDKNQIIKDYYNSLNKTGDHSLSRCLHHSKKEFASLMSSLKKGYSPEKYTYPLIFINNRVWDGRGRISIMSFLKTPTYKIKVKKYKWSSFLLMMLFTAFLLLVHYKFYILVFF